MTDTASVLPKPKKSVALSGTAAGNTALCTVGRSGNDLHYRGYDIHDLATQSTFEEVAHLKAQGFSTWLQANANRTRGEFVLLVHPQPVAVEAEGSVDAAALRTLDVLLKELPLKTAVKLCAEITGQPRNALYNAALARRQGAGDSDD